MNIKHLIWTNEFDPKDEADYRQSVAEREDKPVAEVTDEEMWRDFHECTEINYEDERTNLNKPLDGRVLMIASLGLWTGRHTGYKLTESRNLNAVLEGFVGDFITVGSNGHNIVASDAHHDGTNYYTFREVREDRNIDILLGKLYEGKAKRADINRYTRSLARKVGEIYGW